MPVPPDLPTTKATLRRVANGFIDARAASSRHARAHSSKLKFNKFHGWATLALAVLSALAAGLAALTSVGSAAIALGLTTLTTASKALEPGVAREDQLGDHATWLGKLKTACHRLEQMGAEIHEYLSGSRILDQKAMEQELTTIEDVVAQASRLLDVSEELRAEARTELERPPSPINDAIEAADAFESGSSSAEALSPAFAADVLPEFAGGVVAVGRGGDA